MSRNRKPPVPAGSGAERAGHPARADAIPAAVPTTGVRRRLLTWYDRNRRSLPWRVDRDPYHVLVSEMMLQQTTVKTVLAYYRPFIERFPNWEALAGASEEEVLAAWAGLGYYSRARNLQRTAAIVTTEESGVFPRDITRARRLPGVGDYTAGAVLSIAYGLPVPAVDGNVARVLSRLHGVRGNVSRAPTRSRLRELAASLAHGSRVSDLNQALMELGALVCTPAEPGCGACPLDAICTARALGVQAQLPETPPRGTAMEILSAAAVIRRAGRFLLMRRGDSRSLGKMWEFPSTLSADLALPRSGSAPPSPAAPYRRLERYLADEHSMRVRTGVRLGLVRHSITWRRLRLEVYAAVLRDRLPSGELRWFPPAEFATIPVTSLTRKILSVALGQPAGGGPARAVDASTGGQ